MAETTAKRRRGATKKKSSKPSSKTPSQSLYEALKRHLKAIQVKELQPSYSEFNKLLQQFTEIERLAKAKTIEVKWVESAKTEPLLEK